MADQKDNDLSEENGDDLCKSEKEIQEIIKKLKGINRNYKESQIRKAIRICCDNADSDTFDSCVVDITKNEYLNEYMK